MEFEDYINEIFRLVGKNWLSYDGGRLRILGNSIEEFEEKRLFKHLKNYPKTSENLNKAYDHKLKAEWNDVSLYCCKSIENFYKDLLGHNRKYEKLSLLDLTQEIRRNLKKNFRISDSAIMKGIDNLLLSGINIVGTIRNTRDSGHGNERNVLKVEAKLGYSYTILLLRTLIEIMK